MAPTSTSQLKESLKKFNIILDDDNVSISNSNDFWLDCPECQKTKKNSSSFTKTLRINAKGDWVCHHCFYNGNAFKGTGPKHLGEWGFHEYLIPRNIRFPQDNSYFLPPLFFSWLIKALSYLKGISPQTVMHFQTGFNVNYYRHSKKNQPGVHIPYYLNGQIINRVHFLHTKDELVREFEPGCESVFFNQDSISNESTIIAFGELDVLSLYEAGFNHVIGVPTLPEENKKGKDYADQFSFLLQAEKSLDSVKSIIFALPNTEKHQKLQEELARRLGKERCSLLQWPSNVKNCYEMLIHNGKESLVQMIQKARPYPIAGIFEAIDVDERIDFLYEYGLPPGVKTGWPTLNELYTVKEGQWTLVTGIPGHGKSNLLDAMLINVARDHNWRFGMFSPENQPIERHFANLMEKYADASFSLKAKDRMSVEMKNHSKKWVNDHFYVILPDDTDGNWSIDGILGLAKALVFRKGIKGLVIDPWNELDHSRSNGLTETEHISQALTKIRQFARSYGVHVWVVAHPAKLFKETNGLYPVPTPYDVSGSSHWNNKADNAISIWRNRGSEDQTITEVHVQKIRFKEVGQVGVAYLRYNPVSGCFIDDIDQEKRYRARSDNRVEPTDQFRIPKPRIDSSSVSVHSAQESLLRLDDIPEISLTTQRKHF